MSAKIRCKICGEVLESTHRHDWICCSCMKEDNSKGCYIDGGGDPYIRIGGNPEDIEYWSEEKQCWEDMK